MVGFCVICVGEGGGIGVFCYVLEFVFGEVGDSVDEDGIEDDDV